MIIISIFVGLIFLSIFFVLLIFGKELFIDLFTGEARKLGIFWHCLAVCILVITLMIILVFLGINGVLGKIIVS